MAVSAAILTRVPAAFLPLKPSLNSNRTNRKNRTKSEEKPPKQAVFLRLSLIFVVLEIAVLRRFQWWNSGRGMSERSRRNRQIPNPSLTAKESDDLPGGIGLTVIRPSQDIRRLPGRQRMLSSD